MLKRKKRIPYDPPGQRKPQKRSSWKRSDQIYLSRRSLLLKGTVAAGFAALVTRLGYMQIINGDYYEERTANSTTQYVIEKPTRGMIFDRVGRPLAENRRVWEVQVTPSKLPDPDDQQEDYERVRNTLITALHLPDTLVIDPNAVPLGTEETVYRRVAYLLGYSEEEDIQQFLDVIDIRSKYNYLVQIEGFDDADAPTFRAAEQELPGVSVINQFDYLTTNTAVRDLPIVLKKDVPKQIAMSLESNKLLLPGVELNDSAFVRVYASGNSMSHVLGYVGPIGENERKAAANQTSTGEPYYELDDIIGKVGLEYSMEQVLRGNRGGRLVEIDGFGIETQQLYSNPSVPGRNLKLSIDLELQAAATKALDEGIQFSNSDRIAKDAATGKEYRDYNAGAGAVVALNPKTGEVLALASFPVYDNQLFVDGISYKKYEEYDNDPNKPMVNKAAADHFPPGSTLKLFMAMAGLNENVISPQTTFSCTGGIWVPYTWDESKGDRYLCWQHEGGGHGTLDLISAIEQSCDVFFYNVGTPEQKPEGAERNLHYRDLDFDTDEKGDLHYFEGLGIQKIHSNLKDHFWFGEPTGIELPFEAPGLVPDPTWKEKTYSDGWAAGDTINTSIGQGFFLSTPLQLAVNTAAIANGGTVFRPRMIMEIVDDQGTTEKTFEPEVLRKLDMEQSHLEAVRQGMWLVVNDETGTANRVYNSDTGEYESKWPFANPAGDEPIEIAGKTGTAEVGQKKEDGTYADSHAWFTCYAPFDNPEIVLTVFIKAGGEGSSYAVPVADKVLRAYFELAGSRKRGEILDKDGIPVPVRESSLPVSGDETDATPVASPAASPVASPVAAG